MLYWGFTTRKSKARTFTLGLYGGVDLLGVFAVEVIPHKLDLIIIVRAY